MSEILRVLKPGGLLLFAENLRGSRLHQYARSRFVEWGKSWRYPSMDEFKELLLGFSEVQLASHGFFAAFGGSERQRRILHIVDLPFTKLIPAGARYIMFGAGRK
jgi:hypothetical protein